MSDTVNLLNGQIKANEAVSSKMMRNDPDHF